MKDVWIHSSDWDNGYCVGKIEGAKDGYNLALEDFAELLLKHKSKDEYPVMCFDEFTINKFVEQLKK